MAEEYSCLVGVEHKLRSHFLVKLFWSQKTKRNNRLLERAAFLVSLLSRLGNIYSIINEVPLVIGDRQDVNVAKN